MPVGTLATVKGISTEQLLSTGAEMVLQTRTTSICSQGKTWLLLEGSQFGYKPMLTDSGGFKSSAWET